MKIAQVCPYDFSRPGGVKNHIESLSKYLRRLGHEVKIIAPQPRTGQADVYHFGGNRSLSMGGTKIDINIALGKDKKALKKFISEEKFDIIHFHTFWNPAIPFQIRTFSKAKHVTTFHDTPKNKFVGKTIMPLAARGVFMLMDAIISVSKTQAAYIDRLSSRPIHIIPNGIDLEQYKETIPLAPHYSDGKFNLLFLGRLEERKGLMYALETYKTLKATNDSLRLIIVGDGDERSMAESFVKTHMLTDVEMLGFVSEDKKLELLTTADLYLAPALFGESFGIVLLEAMAMGTPIVGFANEGYLNVLSPLQRQYFTKPGHQNELTSSAQALIKSPSLRGKLVEEGLSVCQMYDWKEISRRIDNVYQDII